MSASKTRREKRATKTAENRLSKKANGAGLGSLLKDYAKVEDVNRAFQQLSRNQESFGKLFNTNIGAIKHSFELTDAWQHVIRRVINDLVKGTLERSEEGVDWEWYFGQYNGVFGFASATVALKKEPEVLPSTAEPPADDFVFGGTNANQNSPPG